MVRYFFSLFLILFFQSCSTFAVYTSSPEKKDIGIENYGEIRVSNFTIRKINGEPIEGKIREEGFSPFISRPAPERNFFIPPGNYTFDISFFSMTFRYHAGRQETVTYTSREDVPLKVSIKPNEVICICYKNASSDSTLGSVIPEARIYTYPDDFKPPVYIPYASSLNFLPSDCYGGDGKTAQKVGQSNIVPIFKSAD